MTEEIQLEQSEHEWKVEVNMESVPRSLEEKAFIFSAGIFGAILAYSAVRFLPACCFFAIPWGILLGAVGGAAGAALGAARRGPFLGLSGAIAGTVLSTVAVGIIEIAVLSAILGLIGPQFAFQT